ncbi:hypothetical protein GY45DRAFT_950875 [Cubamyces sp. BRFM 1775]|nr:hypothetical protein GY45DRAFT_950875 [Cubamyces sp. BRFM 1775]
MSCNDTTIDVVLFVVFPYSGMLTNQCFLGLTLHSFLAPTCACGPGYQWVAGSHPSELRKTFHYARLRVSNGCYERRAV